MKSAMIIAEAGVNHNGSLSRAKELVDAAVASGADAVKFQTFKSELVVSRFAEKADYQKAAMGTSESQLEMVRKLEISEGMHQEILDHCRSRNIRFMSTPFDLTSASFLVKKIQVDVLKIPSGEISNVPFLLQLGRFRMPVIVSTGMSTLGEVELALGALAFGYLDAAGDPSERAFRDVFSSDIGQEVLQRYVSLLHCTTEYPAPFEEVNLRAMDTLAAAFNLPVGLSDHTLGISIAIAAVARGARIVEKHLTIDRNLPGPDHKASLEPKEFIEMVTQIRQVEKALGCSIKRPTPAELSNRIVARRSLVAHSEVAAGEIWTEQNLTCKRPGNGISPNRYWEMLGTQARRAYRADEQLD